MHLSCQPTLDELAAFCDGLMVFSSSMVTNHPRAVGSTDLEVEFATANDVSRKQPTQGCTHHNIQHPPINEIKKASEGPKPPRIETRVPPAGRVEHSSTGQDDFTAIRYNHRKPYWAQNVLLSPGHRHR